MALSKEDFDAKIKNINELNGKLYYALADLSLELSGDGGAENMARTAFATAVAIYRNCGFEGEELKKRVNVYLDEYIAGKPTLYKLKL